MNADSTPNSRANDRRWFAVGHSDDTDSHTAGRNAAEEAVCGDDAKLVIVFCSQAYDLGDLLAGIHTKTNGAPLIGCTTAGEIAASKAGDESVAIVALGGDGFSIATASATPASRNLRKAGAEAAACLGEIEPTGHRVLMMLSDGLAGNQQEIVRGAYGVVGASVPLVGGCAGDDLNMAKTYQLYDDQVLENAVVSAAIRSDSPMGIGVRHGWRKVGESMLITKSRDNRVYTIDNKPALDVYLERLDAPDEARRDSTAFTHFATTHPLGLSRRSTEEVRYVGEADFTDRSLGCIAEVPQGGLAWFMEGDEESVQRGTVAACQEALEPLGGLPPLGFLAFDCIARRSVLGDSGVPKEMRAIADYADGAPVAGFYTYGEFARTSGIRGFHNQTLVVLAVS